MDVLLILSSKLVSDEMKDLFGQIPSSLIPVNGKTLLEIIYENNKNKYDKIVVTGKEKVELINEVVKNKKMDIDVFEIDELRDIGYSIYKALENLNNQEIENLTINFADTYYSDDLEKIKNRNSFLYAQIEESERWATFDLDDKNFSIMEKKDLKYKEKYDVLIGIFNFINYSNFFNILSKYVKSNFKEGDIDSFYKSIEEFYKNNSIDLSIYCKEFDEIIIFEEGHYYDVHENGWIGPKIYYFQKGNIKKIINLHCVPADVPYGTIIYFYPYTDGKIILSKGNTIFYLTQIEKYKTGKLLRLENQKKDIQTWSFK